MAAAWNGCMGKPNRFCRDASSVHRTEVLAAKGLGDRQAAEHRRKRAFFCRAAPLEDGLPVAAIVSDHAAEYWPCLVGILGSDD